MTRLRALPARGHRPGGRTLLANRAASEGYEPDEFTLRSRRRGDRGAPALDAELAANSPAWPLSRIAPLERSILRLALWELRSGETPPEVAIDEAVRLAKRYSTDEAAALVNGILAGGAAHRPAAAAAPAATRSEDDA